jgi:ABC-2 type transport system ATP-binding protein
MTAVGAPALLEVAGLTKRYGDQVALADVGFSVQSGEVLGLIGPNGAGKTTLLEAMAGVLPADAGRVFWCGAPVKPGHRRRRLFYLPEGVQPWHDQFVWRALVFFAGAYRRSRAHIVDAVAAAGLAPVLRKRIHALSRGYGRRFMWALALLAPHPLLLMDEPFDGFDLKQTREMILVLRQIVAKGRTLVVSIHQLSDAERVCDRFVLLADGCIRGSGTIEELRTGLRSGGLEDVFLALA